MQRFCRLLKTAALAAVVLPAAVSVSAFLASFFIPAGTYLPAKRASLDQSVKTISGIYRKDQIPEGVDKTFVVGEYSAGTVRT